jgi:hypothetical protein
MVRSRGDLNLHGATHKHLKLARVRIPLSWAFPAPQSDILEGRVQPSRLQRLCARNDEIKRPIRAKPDARVSGATGKSPDFTGG